MHQSNAPEPLPEELVSFHPHAGLATAVRTDLPTPLSTLVGRQQAIAAVCSLARRPETRLLTLTGPGGVGKTRLALAVAAELAPAVTDGVAFISLAPVTDVQEVIPAIAHRLGVRFTGASSVSHQLAHFIHDRHLLLVLDNVEQVLGAAPAISELLATCPRLTVMVTSRASLGVSGEQRFEVPPLSLPNPDVAWTAESLAQSEAVQLFVVRAQALDLTFKLDRGNARDVAAICTRLDGLPLALELAAARLTIMSPSEILGELDICLRVLAGGPTDQPPRLQTMRDAITWSWALLSSSEQALLRHLAVFTGGFTLEAANAVCGNADHNVFDDLVALVRHSLVQRHISEDGTSRFGFLETIHAFARDQLDTADERGDYRTQHARHFAERVPLTWWLPTEMVGDQANIYTALEWSIEHTRTDLILPLAVAVWQFFEPVRGYHLLERAVVATANAPSALLSRRVLLVAATAQYALFRGDQERARELLELSASLRNDAPDDPFVALSLLTSGWVAIGLGEFEHAAWLARAAKQIWTAADATGWVGESLILLGMATRRGHATHRSEQLFAEALAHVRTAGHPMAAAAAFAALAEEAVDRDDPYQAAALTAESLTRFLSHGLVDPLIVIGSGKTLARAAVMAGYPSAAARLLGAVAAQQDRLGIAELPGDKKAVDHILDQIHTHLSAADFDGAWTGGQQLPMVQWLEWTRDLAAEIGRLGPAAGPFADNPLTPRERDVLRLVAAGWSNRKIAEALSRSERTVENHLSHILAKLNVDSRTAAVAAAADLGIMERGHPSRGAST